MANDFSEEYLKAWNAYFYPDSETFINKLDIRDKDELEKKEAELTFERICELILNPIEGNFDKEHLCKIHEYIFQDLYDWAGKYRTIHMGKNNSHFALPNTIDNYLEEELKMMNSSLEGIYGPDRFAAFLTEYYIVLLNVHPFREGNGRTIREFLREFTVTKSKEIGLGEYDLDWSKVDDETIDKMLPFAMSIRSPIEFELRKALVPKEKENENTRRI